MSGTSKRNSSRISSSSSASSSPANPPPRDGEGAADVQAENARRRQRRTRENEIGGDNLGDDQSPPPQGGGGLSVVSRRGLSPSRQGRQSQPPADGNDTITHTNVIANWNNYTVTEMNQPQVQKVLDCRITGEANGLLYAHPLRGCFTTASAQFLCNILATKADDVQALWEASGETQRLLQPSIKPEDEASLTAILNGWEKMALSPFADPHSDFDFDNKS